MPDAMILDYGTQGVLVPLEDMIPTYAPNVALLMQQKPAFKSLITAPDGHIYALATGAAAPWSDISWHLHINNDWLERLGLEMPTTTDEFYEVLLAFKNSDPNGNGDADEIKPCRAQCLCMTGLTCHQSECRSNNSLHSCCRWPAGAR